MNPSQELMTTPPTTDTTEQEQLLRLLHLVSPTLPTGAFSYSQGLEWAVESGWVHDASSFEKWISDILEHAIAFVDIPLLIRMVWSIKANDLDAFTKWCNILLSCRETTELRNEEEVRGRALATLLETLGVGKGIRCKKILNRCQLAGFALAAVEWGISPQRAALGYSWAWLENQIMAGIKTIPLGQTAGQQLLFQLSTKLPEIVSLGLQINSADIGATCQAQALASCLHETQYTRLYRS